MASVCRGVRPLPGWEQSDLSDPTGGGSGPALFPSGSSGCENGKTYRVERGLMVRKARPEVCEIEAGGMSHVMWVQSGHFERVAEGRRIATIMAASVGRKP